VDNSGKVVPIKPSDIIGQAGSQKQRRAHGHSRGASRLALVSVQDGNSPPLALLTSSGSGRGDLPCRLAAADAKPRVKLKRAAASQPDLRHLGPHQRRLVVEQAAGSASPGKHWRSFLTSPRWSPREGARPPLGRLQPGVRVVAAALRLLHQSHGDIEIAELQRTPTAFTPGRAPCARW